MKRLKRWWKKLCVGLAASAKERDITHGKINKFGGGVKAAAAVAALPLLLTTTPEAKAGNREDYRTPADGLVAGVRMGASSLGRYANAENLIRFLGAMNALDSQTKQHLYYLDQTTGTFRELESYRAGYNAGVSAAVGATVGSYSTIAAGPVGGYHYTTVCDF